MHFIRVHGPPGPGLPSVGWIFVIPFGRLAHLLIEMTVWPSPGGWLAVLALGLGPVGIAFFVWDYGVKRGDILDEASASSRVADSVVLPSDIPRTRHYQVTVRAGLPTGARRASPPHDESN